VTKPPVSRATGVAASRHEYPLSTNVSSPIQAASKRRKLPKAQAQKGLGLHSNGYVQDDFVVSDNESAYNTSEDRSDAGRGLIQAIGTSREIRKRKLGPPITTDEKLERLNSLHQMVVVEFMHDALALGRKVSSLKYSATLLPTRHDAHGW